MPLTSGSRISTGKDPIMKTFPVLTMAVALAACGGTETTDNAGSVTDSTVQTPMTADAGTTNSDNMTDGTVPTDANGYLAMAGSGDMWEIESSKALIAKSQNADLKKFAQMMIDNHTQSTEKLKAAAKSANVTPPAPKLDAEQQRMLDELRTADANSIDMIYMRHQATAHQKALALHQGFAANGDNDALKKAAGEIVPVVERHIAELSRMSASS
ncbi:DUF4142 domain-containing protein [Sphingorhabdus contaminans]|uniref:DUF4142 domain-containing protein n=2 Tax=Sphingorhabdus contaminans TaxID=1343899 RepID=A0A553WJZ4_9SPHN|nr:DUF4142 domain-containing protein [Sphingorhabdus contaminans]